MTQHTPDDDWLNPEPSTDLIPVTDAPFAGVYRIEAQGEEGIPFDTLVDALCEPPMGREAEIRGKGGCLAQSHPDLAKWVPTQLGAQRIEREVEGLAGAA